MPGRSVTQRASCRALRCSWMPGHHTLRTLRFDILPRPKTSGDDTLSNDGNARPLLRQEREGPDRSALRHLVLELLARNVPVSPPMPDSTVTYCRPWCV